MTSAAATSASSARTAYLRRLEAAVSGPRRTRRELLREAADHLDDATDAYQRAGYAEHEAAGRAVADFGTVEEVAPAFQTTLAVAASRRTALLLLVVLAAQPFVWDGGVTGGSTASDGRGPATASPLGRVLDGGVEVLGGSFIVAAVLLMLGTGVGNRWFRAGPAVARVTGYVAFGAALSVPLIGVVMTALDASAGRTAWLLLGGFVLLPMTVTAAAARRCLTAARPFAA